jgi:hypothetical protein
VRRVLLHPLLWSAVCLIVAVPLLGTEHDFWGFLLCLLAGWSAAHALVRRLVTLPDTLSLVLHLAASVGAALLLFALSVDDGWRRVLPPAKAAAIGFAAVPAAGWIWLTFIGRTSAAVAGASRRRAATLVVPEWERVGDAWHLPLAVIALRSPVYVAITAAIAVLCGGLVTAAVIVLDDVVQRMGPLLLLLIVAWVVGAPGYLVLRAIAHRRTVDVVVILEEFGGSATVRVMRSSDGIVLVEAPASALGSLRFAPRSSPTRIVVRPSAGSGLVLLVGLARRRRDTAPTFALPPAHIIRRLESAGLVLRSSARSRNGDLTLEAAEGGAPT